MQQNVLTVMTPVKSAGESDLAALLKGIGDDIAGNVHLHLADSRSTHFARFVLIDGEASGKRLLFSACFDGSVEDYVAELVQNLGVGLDKIFGYCDEYPPRGWFDAKLALPFVTNHNVGAGALAIGFPSVSVAEIVRSRKIREQLDDLLDRKEFRSLLLQLGLDPLVIPPPPPPKISFVSKLQNVILELLTSKNPGTSNPNAIVSTDPSLVAIEDRVAQNQMTIVSPNGTGFRRLLLRFVLWFANVTLKVFGSISGLPTIHFAYWTVIDGGNNLLFVSNYDGSWENYIDDFVDYAHVGLDAIWGQCPEYPPGGCRDIESFKAVIRRFQYAAQVFYSAYPDQSMANIHENLALAKALDQWTKDEGFSRFITGAHDHII